MLRRRDRESSYEINAASKGEQLRELTAFFGFGGIPSDSQTGLRRALCHAAESRRQHRARPPPSSRCWRRLLFDSRPACTQSPLHTSPGRSLPGRPRTPLQRWQLARWWRTSILMSPRPLPCSVPAHPSPRLSVSSIAPHIASPLVRGALILRAPGWDAERGTPKSPWPQWAPHGLGGGGLWFSSSISKYFASEEETCVVPISYTCCILEEMVPSPTEAPACEMGFYFHLGSFCVY